MPDTFTATRYHSLAVVDGTVPVELEVTARTDGGVIMALQHRDAPVYGVQFHPESVMTEGGHRMLANWLAVVGDQDAVRLSDGLSPRIAGSSRDRHEVRSRVNTPRTGQPVVGGVAVGVEVGSVASPAHCWRVTVEPCPTTPAAVTW